MLIETMLPMVYLNLLCIILYKLTSYIDMIVDPETNNNADIDDNKSDVTLGKLHILKSRTSIL